MNTLQTLLQVASALLLMAQHNPQMPMATQKNIIAISSHSIQLATQATAKINYPQTPSTRIWPNYERLASSLYIDPSGARVPLGSNMALVGGYTSFGDMNNDDMDDAMVVVRVLDGTGNPSLSLAAMLNQGGILFNIADLPLGVDTITVYDHHVIDNTLNLDATINGVRKVYHYQVLGNQIISLPPT